MLLCTLSACGDGEPPVTECRNEIRLDVAQVVCPHLRVVYDFEEARTSFYDGDDRPVIQNATPTYRIGDDELDVSDMDPNEQRVPNERRHGSSVRLPEAVNTACGRSASLEIRTGGTSGTAKGEFVQLFTAYTGHPAVIVTTQFTNPSEETLLYTRVSFLKTDGLKHPWSGTRSAVFVGSDARAVGVERSPDAGLPQTMQATGGGRSFFVGELAASIEPPFPGEQTVRPGTTFTWGDFDPNRIVKSGGRVGQVDWSLAQEFGDAGVLLVTRAEGEKQVKRHYLRAVHYLDFISTDPQVPRDQFAAAHASYPADFCPGL